MREQVADTSGDGLEAAVTGPAGFTADLTGAFAGIDGLLLIVAFAAVFVILVIVYRSPLLPLIVLGTSVTALCTRCSVVVGSPTPTSLVLNGQTQGILFILVIGAATDYSLLYIARYREALHTHERKWDATWAALRGSWEPILASGGTVIAGLLMLLASELKSNKILGPVSAIGIVFAVLAALTLLPALMLLGRPGGVLAGAAEVRRARRGRRRGGPPRRVAEGRAPHRPPSAGDLGRLDPAARRHGARDDAAEGRRRAVERVRARASRRPATARRCSASISPAARAARGRHRLRGGAAGVADVLLATDGVEAVSVVSGDSPSGSLPVTEDGIQALGPPGTPAGEPTVVDGRVQLEATLADARDSDAAEAVVSTCARARRSARAWTVLVGGATATSRSTRRTRRSATEPSSSRWCSR